MTFKNLLDRVNRIIVKIGTAGVTTDHNINKKVIADLAKGCYELHKKKKYITIVTSGAIASGRRRLKAYSEGSLVEKQTYAAVGQPILMQEYIKQFEKFGMGVAQFLVSRGDFFERERFKVLQDCYNNTLVKGIVPIFNENDTIATDEIKFSDNDELEALIAAELNQDLMINLIVYNGLLKNGRTVRYATSYNEKDYDNLGKEVKETRGGLKGKLNAIKRANRCGKICIVGNIRSNLLGLIEGKKILHTRFLPTA